MKKVLIEQYGSPTEVVRCVEADELSGPGPHEVVFDVLASPIHPSDLMFIKGFYDSPEAPLAYATDGPPPLTPGTDCVARITAVGDEVSHVAVDDLVMTMILGTWAQSAKAGHHSVIKLPDGMDLKQASMMRANPSTALLMLTDIVQLAEGDWIVQNVANSALGRILITLARDRGIRTVNIVRREHLVDELKALGADVVVVDGPGLAKRIREATGGQPIKLGLDAIGGQAAKRLGYVVSEGGTVCNYGRLSGPEVAVMSSDLILRDIRYVGFLVFRSLNSRTFPEVSSLFWDLALQIREGKLQQPVEATYPLEQISTAIQHAQQEGRQGKILLTPNGAV